MLTSLCLILIGLLFSLILFFRFPFIPADNFENKRLKISAIIPARNEEHNLALLLEDLNRQSTPVEEIICVDDCSTDRTAEIAGQYQTKLISITEKPSNWQGKSWACQKGSEAAKGELLLFLDADVRLGVRAVEKISEAYMTAGCTVSVQPYHRTRKLYEQLSLFFNLVQFAANGLGGSNHRYIGLCGPVILISRDNYRSIGGHEKVKESVIDDIALGQAMKKAFLPFRLFLGDKDISYRMYANGFCDLFCGWLKNIALGAVRTPVLRFAMIFMWITSCLSTVIDLTASLTGVDPVWIAVFAATTVAWMAELFRISRKIGKFNFLSIILFPIPLAFFLSVCVLSAIKRLLGIKTVWKGRKV